MTSVFAKYEKKAYPFVWEGTLQLERIAGGTPSDPKVAEGWLKTKVQAKDDLIREEVAAIMVERGVDADEALEQANINKHLNGFKRDETGLYIEGRQLKACIKEAANIRWPKERWGISKKGTLGFFSEHVFVVEDRLPLGVIEPSSVEQRFVHTWRGTGIQYLEVVEDGKLSFTVETDHDFKAEEWGLLWLTAQHEGIGASRSQGFGRFEVVRWDRLA